VEGDPVGGTGSSQGWSLDKRKTFDKFKLCLARGTKGERP
jgi:hypothetical protein